MIGKILGAKSLAVLLGTFGCLIVVASIFQVEDITRFKVTAKQQIAVPAFGVGVGLVLLSILCAFLIERRSTRDRKQNGTVSEIPPSGDNWEKDLQDSVDKFPEALKRILASNLAEKLKKRIKEPYILLAVQASGQWLATHLAVWLARNHRIILAEKDIPKDRAGEYLEIPVNDLKIRPNLYIVHKELDQNSGNIVIVDDFIDGGATVRSIVERLEIRKNNVKAVATIAVNKKTLNGLEDYLEKNAVKLVYLLKAEGGLP